MYVSFQATALSQTFFNEGLVENHLYSEMCHIAPEGSDPALLPQWAVGKVKLSRSCSVDCASGNDVQWEFHHGCNGTSPFSICFRQGTVRPASGGPPEHCMSSQGAILTFSVINDRRDAAAVRQCMPVNLPWPSLPLGQRTRVPRQCFHFM